MSQEGDGHEFGIAAKIINKVRTHTPTHINTRTYTHVRHTFKHTNTYTHTHTHTQTHTLTLTLTRAHTHTHTHAQGTVGKKAASLKKGKTQATKQKGFKVIMTLQSPPATKASNLVDTTDPAFPTHTADSPAP
jgi:hypothetical protein